MPFGAIHYSMAGIVGICPFVVTNQNTITIEEYRQDPFLKELREQHLRDERPKSCHACYFLEDNGLGSERKDKINHFEEDVYTKDEIHHIEVRFSNLCNSKCRICYDHVSSRIAHENKMYEEKDNLSYTVNRTPGPYEAFVLDQVKKVAPTLRRITFSGGEPLLHWQHWELLDFFIENGYKPKLNYYSNVSQLTYKGQHIYDKWKHFDEVDYRMSADAIGAGHEYWRHGTQWKDIAENIKTIAAMDLPIKRTFLTTTAWPVIYRLGELYEELFSLDPNSVFTNTVVYSPEYTLHALPQKQKEEVAKYLSDLKNNVWKGRPSAFWRAQYDIDGMINYMFSKDWSTLMPTAISNLVKFDLRRNERFLEVFPEWTELMDNYGFNKENWTTKSFGDDFKFHDTLKASWIQDQNPLAQMR